MKRTAIILAVVLIVVLSGAALASIPGPDGVIHGCYKNNNPAQGAVIVVDHTASCPSGYTALNWNQTGPQGPAGADGVSGYEQVTVSAPFSQVASDLWTTGAVTATCPSGKKALGGGVNIPNNSRAWINQSYPSSSGRLASDAKFLCHKPEPIRDV